MTYLWKVTAVKANSKVAKGMEVEIFKGGTNAKPTIKEIGDAFERKYGITLINGCSLSTFEFKLVK